MYVGGHVNMVLPYSLLRKKKIWDPFVFSVGVDGVLVETYERERDIVR